MSRAMATTKATSGAVTTGIVQRNRVFFEVLGTHRTTASGGHRQAAPQALREPSWQEPLRPSGVGSCICAEHCEDHREVIVVETDEPTRREPPAGPLFLCVTEEAQEATAETPAFMPSPRRSPRSPEAKGGREALTHPLLRRRASPSPSSGRETRGTLRPTALPGLQTAPPGMTSTWSPLSWTSAASKTRSTLPTRPTIHEAEAPAPTQSSRRATLPGRSGGRRTGSNVSSLKSALVGKIVERPPGGSGGSTDPSRIEIWIEGDEP